MNWNTIGLIVFFLLLAGFFVGIEAAFGSINRLSVELRKKQGRTGGTLVSYFFERSSLFIGVVLIWLTFCLVAYGLMIGQALEPAWLYLEKILPEGAADFTHLFVEITLAGIIFIFFGEFLPRAIWRSKNEWLLNSGVASFTNFFFWITHPVADMLVTLSQAILKYFFNVRIDEKKESFFRVDLDSYYQQTSYESEGDGQDMNAHLIENALSLPTVRVRQCLIPRKEIEGIEINNSVDKALERFIETKLSKLVVYEGNIDHIVGYIHQLDMFEKPATISEVLLPIPAVPESMNATDLINKFTRERKSMAWVVDEFGGTSGIVTMEDLLEEIFGEIQDEHDTEELEEKKLNDREFIFSGRLELDYLHEKYDLEFSREEAETLSGFIIQHHETIPKIKERIIIDNFEFEILSVSHTRIEMVKLKVLK
jgi:CBS domain containing-hemolysin-like protein